MVGYEQYASSMIFFQLVQCEALIYLSWRLFYIAICMWLWLWAWVWFILFYFSSEMSCIWCCCEDYVSIIDLAVLSTNKIMSQVIKYLDTNVCVALEIHDIKKSFIKNFKTHIFYFSSLYKYRKHWILILLKLNS